MTKRRRETTGEERALFHDALRDGGVPPLKSATPKMAKDEKSAPPRRGIDAGLDGRTAERLRRGQLEPDAKIDLHGMTEARAHAALVRFVKSSQARGLRLILVVTGKGMPPPDDAPFDLELAARSRGVLKTMTPRWLKEPELSSSVADVRAAHRRHGGSGALYVYLRKPKA